MRYQALRSDQNRLFANFLNISPNEDVLHPGIMDVRPARGFKYGDMERVFHSVTVRRNFLTAWAA